MVLLCKENYAIFAEPYGNVFEAFGHAGLESVSNLSTLHSWVPESRGPDLCLADEGLTGNKT